MSPEEFPFQKANRIAEEQAEEIESLAIFQTGSSLRKEDFSPWSDIDLLVVYREKPKQHWKHEIKQGIELSLLQESIQEFTRNLERGVPFELTAIKYGKILKGRAWVKELRKQSYEPKRLTFEYKIQSALNHYVDLLRVPKTRGECYNSAYHSYRELARYLILHRRSKLVEGDAIIRQELEEITPQLARNFWVLRGKRLDPPPSQRIWDIDTLKATLSQQLKKIEFLGEKVFKVEGLNFPFLEKLKRKLKRRKYTLASTSYANFLGRKHYMVLTGRRKGSEKRKIFFFDLDTGELRSKN